MIPNANRPVAEVLTVGGRAYAFGLRWTSAASPSSLEAEAAAAATAEGADAIAIHRGFGQFGLAVLRKLPKGPRGYVYRPTSGAAAIALAAGTSVLGAFPLADGRWIVIAIDRNGILPEGDLVLPDAGMARARIETLIAQSPSSWRRKFVPSDWGIADARPIDPKQLLVRSGAPRLRLAWAYANRFRIRTVFAAGSIGLAASGWLAIHFVAAPVPPAAVYRPPEPVAAVWTPAGFSIDACLSALRGAQRYNAVPGWILEKFSCRAGQSAMLDLKRAAHGQVSLIQALVPQAQLSEDGLSAVLVIPLDSPPRVSAVGGFASPAAYQAIALDLFQRLNGVFTLEAHRRSLPGEVEATAPEQAWRALSWSYRTRAPTLVWAGALSRFGALSVDTLVFVPSENVWQITGKLYARAE